MEREGLIERGGGLFNLAKRQNVDNSNKPYIDQWSVIFVINYNSFLVQVPVIFSPKLASTVCELVSGLVW